MDSFIHKTFWAILQMCIWLFDVEEIDFDRIKVFELFGRFFALNDIRAREIDKCQSVRQYNK